MRRYALISVKLSGSGFSLGGGRYGEGGGGEAAWAGGRESVSQRQERETRGLEPPEPKSPKQGHSSCYRLLMEWGYFSSID